MKAVRSQQGQYVEVLTVNDHEFVAVAFEKAPGPRLPDMGYRYRNQVPIDEYFHNWGRILGQMHRLTQQYAPSSPERTRPRWLDAIANEGDIGYDGELLYQVRCVDDDIQYLGFFESIYSHEHPFCLADR